MADPVHSVKQGSVKPDLIATLKDSSNAVVDLSTADGVRLEVATLSGEEIVITGEVLNASGGVAKFPMTTELTAIPGTHRAAIIVAWTSQDEEGFPNPGDMWVRVLRNSRADT